MTTQSAAAAAGDKTRFSVIISPAHQTRLGQIAKTYHLTQGEVLEVLLDDHDANAMAPRFAARRQAKVAAKGPKKELLKQLSAMSPDQLQALLQQVQAH